MLIKWGLPVDKTSLILSVDKHKIIASHTRSSLMKVKLRNILKYFLDFELGTSCIEFERSTN